MSPDYAELRRRMVKEQLLAGAIRDQRVLAAMGEVPRELFVPGPLRNRAYEDGPLPIGLGQTISQPYIVALMAEALKLQATDRVLEIGLGSGYSAAVLSRIVARVYSIERHATLAAQAARVLEQCGYDNIEVRVGNGALGWPEAAPFDAISVTAGGPGIPPALKEQLAVGGRLVIPEGSWGEQRLLRLTRQADDTFTTDDLGWVAFVPLVDDSA